MRAFKRRRAVVEVEGKGKETRPAPKRELGASTGASRVKNCAEDEGELGREFAGDQHHHWRTENGFSVNGGKFESPVLSASQHWAGLVLVKEERRKHFTHSFIHSPSHLFSSHDLQCGRPVERTRSVTSTQLQSHSSQIQTQTQPNPLSLFLIPPPRM